MFPHGVVYEGVSEEPMSFRGESGANDSMVSKNGVMQSEAERSSDPPMRQSSRNKNAGDTLDRDLARFPSLPSR